MALTPSVLVNNSSDTDATSYNTASYTPGSNKLILALITNFKSGTPDTPSLSGNGLTWVQIGSMVNYDDAGTQQSMSLFRAMGASPSTGALTISFGGITQLGCSWIIVEIDGMDISGTNGSGAIVQSATALVAGGGGASISITLAAFASATNGVFAGFAMSGSDTFTREGGYTSAGSTSNAAPASRSIGEFLATQDTSPSATIGASGPQMGGIAVEIKEAGGVVTELSLPRRLLMGVGI